MPLYRFADFLVEIVPHHSLLPQLCRGYEVQSDVEPTFRIAVTQEDIENERRRSDVLHTASDAQIEPYIAYERLCEQLPIHDAFFMHAAVISYDGYGYAFAAKSGTGKSTHIKLWQSVFKDHVTVVNGDKPIMRLINDTIWAYGTPWSGKENWNNNISVPLKGLCFLSRGEKNTIKRVSPAEALPLLMESILPPKTREEGLALLTLCDTLLQKVPAYRLACNMEEDAPCLAKSVMHDAVIESRKG